MDGSHLLRLRRPASLWCGSAQGIGLAIAGAALAFAYQLLVLGVYDERQTMRAFGGWERDPYEAWILGQGSPALDLQCDLKRLQASDLPAEAFERLYRGRRPLVLMGRAPGQGWTPAARRRGPWFFGEGGGGDGGVWTLQGLRAVLEQEWERGEEDGPARLRVAEDGRELLRAGWWWEAEMGGQGSCRSDAGGTAAEATRGMTLDAFLTMGGEAEEGQGEEEDGGAVGEDEEEEAYLEESTILRTHPGLRFSPLGRSIPAPLAHAFGGPNATTRVLSVGRSRGGLPWHVVPGETWIGAVAGGFTQVLLYPPGRGLRNVTMGALGAGQTHPLLSPWEFVMHALPFLEHVGPDGGAPPSSSPTEEGGDDESPHLTAGDVPPLSCLLRPGDVLYVPGGGWKAMHLHVGDALLVRGTIPAGAAARVEERYVWVDVLGGVWD